MIINDGTYFKLDTNDSSYVFHILPTGQLEHLYYGPKIIGHTEQELSVLALQRAFASGNTIIYDERFPEISLADLCLEYSSLGKGDLREPMVKITFGDGSTTADFIFAYATIQKSQPLKDLPSAHGTTDDLYIVLKERNHDVDLVLDYLVYEDVIVRQTRLVSREHIQIQRLMSLQLDYEDDHYVLTTFNGKWADEMHRHDHLIDHGTLVNETLGGTTSSAANNFIMLAKQGTTEKAGDAYGFHLLYSGNHKEAVQADSYDHIRVLVGMNDFSYELKANETFEAPEAVMCYGAGFDDLSSLGDWYVNKKKFSKGLADFSKRIHQLSLSFGLWVEPEMISVDSDLYKAHPDWAMAYSHHSEGRHQRVIDLCNDKVVDYLIQILSELIEENHVDYIKWDMNRNFSDYYSPALDVSHQSEVSYRYMLSLYKLLKTLTKRFPNVYFEGCASGGNWFDLGMLCFFDSIWASDNTDAAMRYMIQKNYSYGYPASVIDAHVSSAINHQTLSHYDLNSRFAIAALGNLGYELNLADLNAKEQTSIRDEIALYKRIRKSLASGRLVRTEYGMGIIADDDSIFVQESSQKRLAVPWLALHTLYHISRFGSLVNTVLPVHLSSHSFFYSLADQLIALKAPVLDLKVNGSLLRAGIALASVYEGAGYNEKVRLLNDHPYDLYIIERVDQSENSDENI